MRTALGDLGLHDIYATLAAEEIDDSVFCDLQDGDLKELSISRGNRRKILTAIAALSLGAAAGGLQRGRRRQLAHRPGWQRRARTLRHRLDRLGSHFRTSRRGAFRKVPY